MSLLPVINDVTVAAYYFLPSIRNRLSNNLIAGIAKEGHIVIQREQDAVNSWIEGPAKTVFWIMAGIIIMGAIVVAWEPIIKPFFGNIAKVVT